MGLFPFHLCIFCLFETRSLCVALADLKLTQLHQPECWDQRHCHYAPLNGPFGPVFCLGRFCRVLSRHRMLGFPKDKLHGGHVMCVSEQKFDQQLRRTRSVFNIHPTSWIPNSLHILVETTYIFEIQPIRLFFVTIWMK